MLFVKHMHIMETKRTETVQKTLLSWYDENKRDLPWRHTADPYAVWISEIMAQQTRITALLPYYERFMRRFPTVEILAAAPPEDVLKTWEGLGYYSRAKNLQSAARLVVSRHGGQLPADKKSLLMLPGIGDYTAGAILSIAFNFPEPAVDGNVLRVFSRLEGSGLDISQPRAKLAAESFVRQCMPESRAGCFTQALMELGALVCLPKTPLCGECPLAAHCAANREGRQRELPVKSAKKPPKMIEKTVLAVIDGNGRLLLRQRTEALLGGLWEFLLIDGRLPPEHVAVILKSMGFTVRDVKTLCGARHVFTHMLWQMEGYACRIDPASPPEGYRWVAREEFLGLAKPVALRYFVQALERTEPD